MTESSGGRGSTGFLSSPRRRRRLKLGALLLGIAGVVAIGVVVLPQNNGIKLPKGHHGKVQIVAAAPKHVHYGKADEAAARLAAARFISTAVLRKDPAASWALAAPELRAGTTRKQWNTGNMPVIPFSAKDLESVRWRLDYTIKDHIGLKVAMLPKPNSTVQAVDYEMELVRRGPATNSHWLVDYWAPISPGTASPEQQAKDNAAFAAASKPAIGSAWLLLPLVVLLGAVLIVPSVMIVRGKMRSSRAERAYRASVAEREALANQTSSSSPS
jgi:hypothetical protein